MARLKIYLMNGFFSSLIGAVVEIVTSIIRGNSYVELIKLFRSMGLGVMIGTASLFCIFRTLRFFRKRQVFGYIINFLTVGIIITVYAYVFGGLIPSPEISNWAVAFFVAEALSLILVRMTYTQVTALNEQLARKKAEIQDSSQHR